MSKQDRQGVRTPAGLEQKYYFERFFSNQQDENARYSSEMTRQCLTIEEFMRMVISSLNTMNKDISSLKTSINNASDDSTAKFAHFEEEIAWINEKLKDYDQILSEIQTPVSE